MTSRYELAPESQWRWCQAHSRVATHLLIREGCEYPELNPPEAHCDPALGGNMMPCRCLPVGELARDFTFRLGIRCAGDHVIEDLTLITHDRYPSTGDQVFSREAYVARFEEWWLKLGEELKGCLRL